MDVLISPKITATPLVTDLHTQLSALLQERAIVFEYQGKNYALVALMMPGQTARNYELTFGIYCPQEDVILAEVSADVSQRSLPIAPFLIEHKNDLGDSYFLNLTARVMKAMDTLLTEIRSTTVN